MLVVAIMWYPIDASTLATFGSRDPSVQTLLASFSVFDMCIICLTIDCSS